MKEEVKKAASKISNMCYGQVRIWVKDNWYKKLDESAEDIFEDIVTNISEIGNEWYQLVSEYDDGEEETEEISYIYKECIEAIESANHGD